eukprot:121558-Pyramimonas_sp.AAC.1
MTCKQRPSGAIAQYRDNPQNTRVAPNTSLICKRAPSRHHSPQPSHNAQAEKSVAEYSGSADIHLQSVLAGAFAQ